MRDARERLKFIKPLEPIQVETPPISDDWLHEIKYDGYRTQGILDWAGARAFSRNCHRPVEKVLADRRCGREVAGRVLYPRC
ncbi:hypothetical protein [Mesorhizobium sp. M1A.F.Ca.IN.022.07.1.1]|uniref:hypothetical protein n=1 Tax=Mesorhizobium sp. M1A.F.Ca.IN.022.07.1.1 TaxID=2496767 RepID=UPI001FDF12D9|nr:hypothetical protein [Mesorhizobium sp. M1A.F.Ca.IN.022.07.1.1]